MGRQIAVAMDGADEAQFLEFLRSSADIRLFRSWSPDPESVNSFDSDAGQFWIHNRAFPWEPKFESRECKDPQTGIVAARYHLVRKAAPLIEYSRHPLNTEAPQAGGRLYWEKLFLSQPDQIKYDLAEFERWMESVMRWVKKHGRKARHGQTEPWFLPSALAKFTHDL